MHWFPLCAVLIIAFLHVDDVLGRNFSQKEKNEHEPGGYEGPSQQESNKREVNRREKRVRPNRRRKVSKMVAYNKNRMQNNYLKNGVQPQTSRNRQTSNNHYSKTNNNNYRKNNNFINNNNNNAQQPSIINKRKQTTNSGNNMNNNNEQQEWSKPKVPRPRHFRKQTSRWSRKPNPVTTARQRWQAYWRYMRWRNYMRRMYYMQRRYPKYMMRRTRTSVRNVKQNPTENQSD